MSRPATAETGHPERFPAARNGALSPQMRDAYERDGYLILENYVDDGACDKLRERAGELVAAFDPTDVATIFSTKTQSHAADDYFQTSGDKIRCFFEEEAFGPNGQLRQDKALSINKIGHALHDLDPAFEGFSRTKSLSRTVSDLSLGDPRLLQSMYVFKQPRIGGEVTCHQDATFLYTEPSSVVGLWFALEDATLENGCLFALRGGHRLGLRSRFLRKGAALSMEILDDTSWDESTKVALEAPKGTLVVLHGLLPHLSGPNRSQHSRHAYTLHIIDGNCAYPAENWLQRNEALPLRGFQ